MTQFLEFFELMPAWQKLLWVFLLLGILLDP